MYELITMDLDVLVNNLEEYSIILKKLDKQTDLEKSQILIMQQKENSPMEYFNTISREVRTVTVGIQNIISELKEILSNIESLNGVANNTLNMRVENINNTMKDRLKRSDLIIKEDINNCKKIYEDREAIRTTIENLMTLVTKLDLLTLEVKTLM